MATSGNATLTPYRPNVTFWATAACNIPVRPETLGTNKQRTYRMAAGRALQEVRFGLESLSSQVSSLWPRGLGHCARCEQLWRPAIAHLAYPPREEKSTGCLTWASVLPLGIIFEKREHWRFFKVRHDPGGHRGAPKCPRSLIWTRYGRLAPESTSHTGTTSARHESRNFFCTLQDSKRNCAASANQQRPFHGTNFSLKP